MLFSFELIATLKQKTESFAEAWTTTSNHCLGRRRQQQEDGIRGLRLRANFSLTSGCRRPSRRRDS